MNKIITKIFLFIFIVCVVYIFLVLTSSPLANTIGKTFGLEKFNEFIKKSKGTLDEVSTKDYSNDIEEFKSGAINNLKDTQTKIKDGINGVKETVDDIRTGVNDTVELYEDTKKKAEEVTKTINETAEKIQKVKNAISGSGSKN